MVAQGKHPFKGLLVCVALRALGVSGSDTGTAGTALGRAGSGAGRCCGVTVLCLVHSDGAGAQPRGCSEQTPNAPAVF